jgi:hypothetical protein
MSFFQVSGIHSCHFVESRSAGKEGSSLALPFDNRDLHVSMAAISVGANRSNKNPNLLKTARFPRRSEYEIRS